MTVSDGPSCSGCGLPNYAGLCPHCRGDQDDYERELVPPFPTSRPDEESAARRREGGGDGELAAKAEREARRICRERGLPEALWYLANEYIARLSRELESARKLIRELVDDEDAGIVWTGTRVVCAYCSATDRYDSVVEHDRDCPIERARRALATDTEVSDGE